MSPNLPPPPKFQNQGIGPAPKTAAEWTDFWRWLFAQWKTVYASINAQQSITIAPRAATPIAADEILAAAQAFARIAVPGARADGVREEMPPAVSPQPQRFDETPTPRFPSLSRHADGTPIPFAQQCGLRAADDGMIGLLQSLAARPPYPFQQAAQTTPLTNKGDILGFDTAADRVPVGANGTVLGADSAAALGVSYQARWPSSMNVTANTLGTVYRNNNAALTPRWVSISAFSAAAGATLDILCDASTPPTTPIAHAQYASNPSESPIMFPVLPGYYYKAVGVNITRQYWVEWD